MNNARQLLSFFECTSTFQGFQFAGNHTIPYFHVARMLQHYLDTGQNLLDRYSEIVYLKRDAKKNNIGDVVSSEKDEYLRDCLDHPVIKQMFVPEDIEMCYSYLNSKKIQIKAWSEYENQRVVSNAFISKKTVRERVFEIYGKNCLNCNSDHDVCIDHIIPVLLGGENHIDNLQPLCRSCNSSKGASVMDFRKHKYGDD